MILIPEKETKLEEITRHVDDAYARGKSHCIILVAEGATLSVQEVEKYLNDHEIGFETRVTILGHVPRGGSPSAFDRMLATRFGIEATQVLLNGGTDVMIGLSGRDLVTIPLSEVTSQSRKPNLDLYEIAETLAK
jgi:6-phosphofructokinase 1